MKTRTQSPTSTATSTSADIIASIRAEIPPASQRSRPWHQRVPAEHADTVRAIHDAWHDGLFGTRRYPAARAISKRLRDLGIDIGEQGVIAWLQLPRS
jgi:hypothetical protein